MVYIEHKKRALLKKLKLEILTTNRYNIFAAFNFKNKQKEVEINFYHYKQSLKYSVSSGRKN
jgi:hypothetical protein